MKRIWMLCMLILLLAAVSLTLAQPGGYSLTWWTVDGGGGMSGNGRYTLQFTTGQPDAGTMGSGRYTLFSGYWDGQGQYDVYLPVVMRP